MFINNIFEQVVPGVTVTVSKEESSKINGVVFADNAIGLCESVISAGDYLRWETRGSG
jgi:hypothetical protein